MRGITMIFEKVRDFVIEQTGCAPDDVTLDSSLVDDLGADSLDLVELVMSVEEEFDIEIPDDEAMKLKTVGAVVEYIKANT
jgi:acyl carrier protein